MAKKSTAKSRPASLRPQASRNQQPVPSSDGEAAPKDRVLITGAAGFLGSHLCDRFLKEGYHVIGMDNLITGSLKNIEHLFKREDFEFYHHDVTKFVHVPGELKYILHFASPRQPDRLPEDPDPDPEGELAGHAQPARPRQGQEGAHPGGQHQRGVW